MCNDQEFTHGVLHNTNRRPLVLQFRDARLDGFEGTFEGGFQNFANLFAGKLRELGVKIRLQTPVTLIERRYCFWAQRSTATARP